MKTTHTQGEWVFSKNTNAIFQKENEQRQPKLIAKIVFDKEVNPLCRGAFKTKEESEANAKLIAAAPELLDKLFQLIQSIEMRHVNASADYIEAMYPGFIGAIKSIKKATE